VAYRHQGLTILTGMVCVAGVMGLAACGSTNGSSLVSPNRAERETIASFQPAPAPKVAPATVAVFDFEGGSIPAEKKTEFWGRALATFMIGDLGKTQNLRIIDREHVAEILREQRLSVSDLADKDARLRVGGVLGAKYFIFGTYAIVGQQAALTARMDSVETGKIFEADSVLGDERDLRELSQRLAAKFLGPLDRIVAEQELHPIVGASGPPAEAFSFFNRALAYEKSGDYDRAIDMFTRALTVYPYYADARSELEKASEAAARQQ